MVRMKFDNAEKMMKEAYKDKPMYSVENNIIEQFCDMVISGAIIAEWDLKAVKCRYKINQEHEFWTMNNTLSVKWNEEAMKELIKKHGIPKNPSIKECIFNFIDMGLFIVEDGNLQTNRRDYPNIVEILTKICEERLKQ